MAKYKLVVSGTIESGCTLNLESLKKDAVYDSIESAADAVVKAVEGPDIPVTPLKLNDIKDFIVSRFNLGKDVFYAGVHFSLIELSELADALDAPFRVVVYTRFSPRPDAATSESCDIQFDACKKFAEQKGWAITHRFDDKDQSGDNEYRELLWSAIRTLRRGDILLVYRRDRLARSVYLSEMINHEVKLTGGKIVAVQGDIEGEGLEADLVRQVIAAIAEYEKKLIARRTSLALNYYQNTEHKIVSRTPPFGFEPDPEREGYMRECGKEQRAISIIRELYEGEGRGMTAIAKFLMSRHPDLLRNGRINPSTIMAIIRRLKMVKSDKFKNGIAI